MSFERLRVVFGVVLVIFIFSVGSIFAFSFIQSRQASTPFDSGNQQDNIPDMNVVLITPGKPDGPNLGINDVVPTTPSPSIQPTNVPDSSATPTVTAAPSKTVTPSIHTPTPTKSLSPTKTPTPSPRPRKTRAS